MPVVVVINKFDTDTDDEIQFIKDYVDAPCAVCTSFADGGEGAVELAKLVVDNIEENVTLNHPYDINDDIEKKIFDLAYDIYGADDVIYSKEAQEMMNRKQRRNAEFNNKETYTHQPRQNKTALNRHLAGKKN